MDTWRKNRTLLITLAILLVLFLLAVQGMSTSDWVITMLRGVSVGAITFLVASGLSLIFGLLDVLNLAHGTLFMIGAYVGWTVYVRPDTFVDVLAPVLLLAAGILARPVVDAALARTRPPQAVIRAGAWLMLAVAVLVAILAFAHWPVAKWDPGVPANIPASNSLALDQATMTGQPRPVPEPAPRPGVAALGGFLVSGVCLAASLSAFGSQRHAIAARPLTFKILIVPLVLLLAGLSIYLANDGLTLWLYSLGTTWIFLIAIAIAVLAGALLGGLTEMTLIRPLYSRPIYQLMLTLGVGVAGIELVRAIWGSPEFTMPKPAIFQGTGGNCPATSLSGWLQYNCSTFSLLGGRLRTYNEVFVILVGLIVLVGVWLLLQRSRIGMIIRAGVQDSAMVEALGINVRVVFTIVFALGAALATLGGIIAAPSMGLSPYMGETLLISALIALAIGGLTSFPGAAAGSLLVGLLQQFIIKYGQIGIKIPFTGQVLKPTPPLVPASTVLLMVIILLAMPQGLFGRRE
jgi:branched-chain amino acid transport system permease protein